jgi:choline transport protein
VSLLILLSSSNANIGVSGGIVIISTITWFADGRKRFTGPRDLGMLLEAARAATGREFERIHMGDTKQQAEKNL